MVVYKIFFMNNGEPQHVLVPIKYTAMHAVRNGMYINDGEILTDSSIETKYWDFIPPSQIVKVRKTDSEWQY